MRKCVFAVCVVLLSARALSAAPILTINTSGIWSPVPLPSNSGDTWYSRPSQDEPAGKKNVGFEIGLDGLEYLHDLSSPSSLAAFTISNLTPYAYLFGYSGFTGAFTWNAGGPNPEELYYTVEGHGFGYGSNTHPLAHIGLFRYTTATEQRYVACADDQPVWWQPAKDWDFQDHCVGFATALYQPPPVCTVDCEPPPPVAEPFSLLLFGSGLLAFAMRARRRVQA